LLGNNSYVPGSRGLGALLRRWAMSRSSGSARPTRGLTSSLGAARALVRLACSFISVKLTAVYLGPTGLALIAQFNNFMTLCQSIVISGLETAVARLAAEYNDDHERRNRLLRTAATVGVGLGVPTALAVVVASPLLASWLLQEEAYSWVFVVGAFSILAAIANAVLMAAFSARGDILRVVASNILATIVGVIVFAPASVHWGVAGGLYASSGIYVISLLISLVVLYGSPLIKYKEFVGKFDLAEGKRIASFYPMLIVHSVTAPLSLILIRSHVASVLSLESAGWWQACWRLSETYLMVVMLSVTTQYMVRLGEAANSPRRLRSEMGKTLLLAAGGTCVLAAAIFLLRTLIVRMLFSSAFLPVADYMGLQLIGDVLKMIGIIMGYVLVATVRSRWYIAIEIIVPGIFIGMVHVLGGQLGVNGVTTAYVISGAAHCLLSLVALRDLVFVQEGKNASQ